MTFFIRILLALLSITLTLSHASTVKKDTSSSHKMTCRCQIGEPCWPKKEEWSQLKKSLKGKLIQLVSPLDACKKNQKSKECRIATKHLSNPFYLSSRPAISQYSGWWQAWKLTPSLYAVAAKTPEDISKAVQFAKKHNLRVVIKGTGHDYLGRSNAPPASLLIWTHLMRNIKVHKNFIPHECTKNIKSIPAVTVEAGTQWLEVYEKVTYKHGRYVQGGGCTTVGAAGGFTQGGGFGFFTKNFGTGASNVLEAEIVTADGRIITANQCKNTDLFWAIRGGGGGSFGVVTKMTLKTHPLPKHIGMMEGQIQAKSDKAFKTLIHLFLSSYLKNLNNEHWGIITSFGHDRIKLMSFFQGITKDEAKKQWSYLLTYVAKNPDDYQMNLKFDEMIPRKFWHYHYLKKNFPDLVIKNTLPGATNNDFWYRVTAPEEFSHIYNWASRLLPASLFTQKKVEKLAESIFNATRYNSLDIHFYKGLSGALSSVITQSKHTSISPKFTNAVGLLLIAQYSPEGSGYKKWDTNIAEKRAQSVNKAINIIRQITPNGGSYANEADYFEPNWQESFWGDHYSKLLAIKAKYDPSGLFYCHHCVGSELWIDNGMCKATFNKE